MRSKVGLVFLLRPEEEGLEFKMLSNSFLTMQLVRYKVSPEEIIASCKNIKERENS